MADERVVTIDGRPISELRVVDLKKELDKRRLSKSGSKKELIERLRSHLHLERLREKSLQEGDQAPSIQVKDVVENDFVKQYMQDRERMFEIQMQEKKKIVAEEEKRKRESASEDESMTPKKRSAESASEDEQASDPKRRCSYPSAGEQEEPATSQGVSPGSSTEPRVRSQRKITRRSLQEMAPERKSPRRSTSERSEGELSRQMEGEESCTDLAEAEDLSADVRRERPLKEESWASEEGRKVTEREERLTRGEAERCEFEAAEKARKEKEATELARKKRKNKPGKRKPWKRQRKRVKGERKKLQNKKEKKRKNKK